MALSCDEVEPDRHTSARPPLPVSRSPLVGRAQEVSGIAALLSEPATRLITLVGVGGAGKSRLALGVAHQVARSFADGAAFAALEGVSDAALVPAAAAEALGIHDPTRRTDLERVVTWMRGRRVLLVLDTLEHLPDAAPVIDELLARCPGLRALCTSRVPLHLAVERRVPVAPLAVPAADASLSEALSSPALRLLLDRIGHNVAEFSFDDDSAPVLIDLVRRLDGLPLALELAAGRIRQGTKAIERLADLFAVDRSAPRRQRTVRAVIDWSYGALSPAAQAGLRAVSLHVGSFDVEGARCLAGADFDIGTLVDLSLVQQIGDRFSLLALVRDYAASKRSGSPEEAGIRGRWIARALELAESHAAGAVGPDQVELEHDNLRAVLDDLLSSGDPRAVCLAGSLTPFWALRGHYHEGRRWLRRALVAAPTGTERTHALYAAGRLAFLQCDYVEAGRLLGEAVAAVDSDSGTRLEATQALGCVARERGDYAASTAHHRACLALSQDPRNTARSRAYLGFVGWLSGDFALARSELACAATAFTALGDAEGMATTQIYLGGLALSEGDAEAARSACSHGLSLSEAAGFQEGVAWARNLLGLCDLETGDHAAANDALRAALRTHLDLGDVWRASSVIEAIARVNAALGRYGRAARLLGAATQLRESIGTPVPPVEQPALGALQETLALVLASALDAEIASGRHLELEDAAALARAEGDDTAWAVWW